MYIGLELPTEEKAFEMKKERAILINDSMDYIAERSWLLLRHTEPPISKESFENQVTQTKNSCYSDWDIIEWSRNMMIKLGNDYNW